MTKTTASIKDSDIQGTNGSFLLLRAATAKKLGKQSEGGIEYQILGNTDRTSLHLTITANSNGGYFSREIVPFQKIEDCLGKLEKDKPFSSKSLKDTFIGRSSNNAGFLAAILRSEGLLAASSETDTQHIVSGDWSAWTKATLAEVGTPIELPSENERQMPIALSAGPDHKERRKTLTIASKKST